MYSTYLIIYVINYTGNILGVIHKLYNKLI